MSFIYTHKPLCSSLSSTHKSYLTAKKCWYEDLTAPNNSMDQNRQCSRKIFKGSLLQLGDLSKGWCPNMSWALALTNLDGNGDPNECPGKDVEECEPCVISTGTRKRENSDWCNLVVEMEGNDQIYQKSSTIYSTRPNCLIAKNFSLDWKNMLIVSIFNFFWVSLGGIQGFQEK